MYKVGIIFRLIFISLQGGRSDQLQNTECCDEPNCSYLSANTAGNDGTYSQPTNYSGPPCHRYSFSSIFYRVDDQFIRLKDYFEPCFHFSPYYDCKVVTRSKTTGNLYIKCPCENTTVCCPPGNLIFDRKEETGSFWECSLKREQLDYWGYLRRATKGREPHILLRNIFDRKNYNISNDSTEVQYIIIRSPEPYSNVSNGDLRVSNLYFERKFQCSVEEINGNNPRKDLVCSKHPLFFSYQISHRMLRYWCIGFGSVTLLVVMLLPSLWTMKTTIILCQTFSYLITDLIVLRHNLSHSLGEWPPTNTVCISVVYNWHYWDLAASFWGHIMSIDLALTFRGRGFNHGNSRRTFLLYIIYGWVSPLIITLVTMILSFWVTLPRNTLKPEVNLEQCWFHTPKDMLLYHYVPEMILSTINTPLLGYAVYNIIKGDCTSDRLRNEDSGRYVGNRVRKESRARLILYFNLSLLIGSPKWFEYVKLLLIEAEPLVWHIIRLVRTICMFLFLCGRRKVFKLLKKRLHLDRLSVSCLFTTFSSNSYDVSSPEVSSSVPQETSGRYSTLDY